MSRWGGDLSSDGGFLAVVPLEGRAEWQRLAKESRSGVTVGFGGEFPSLAAVPNDLAI